MAKAIIMGIDPSYKHLATSTLYDDKTIYLTCDGLGLGDRVDFTKSFVVADELTNNVVEMLREWNVGIDYIISEIPAPNMQYSLGLSVLDSLLLYKLSVVLKSKKIYTLSPSFLSHLHGTNKYSKRDSVTLALHFMEVLENLGYEIGWDEKRLNPDMSEAFLFMIKGIVLENINNLRDVILAELGSFEGDYCKILKDITNK